MNIFYIYQICTSGKRKSVFTTLIYTVSSYPAKIIIKIKNWIKFFQEKFENKFLGNEFINIFAMWDKYLIQI